MYIDHFCNSEFDNAIDIGRYCDHSDHCNQSFAIDESVLRTLENNHHSSHSHTFFDGLTLMVEDHVVGSMQFDHPDTKNQAHHRISHSDANFEGRNEKLSFHRTISVTHLGICPSMEMSDKECHSVLTQQSSLLPLTRHSVNH